MTRARSLSASLPVSCSLLVLCWLSAIGCAHRPAPAGVSSVSPKRSVHEYIRIGELARARQAAFRNLDDARLRGDPARLAAAELDVGEVMMRLGEHDAARRYLFAVDARANSRDRETARALLALSYHRAMQDTLARTYFSRLDPGLVSPRVWPEVSRAFGMSTPRVAVASVDIRARTSWGAQPFRSRSADPMGPITRITIHHTAIESDSSALSDAASQMRSIQRSHFARGWAGVGYHYVIDSAGRVWEGRPVAFQGAHAGNHDLNRGNIGVSLMGNFDQHHVPRAQRDACAQLLLDLCVRHEITPSAVRGHSDLKQTQCPGAHLSKILASIVPDRVAIASARRGAGTVTVPIRGSRRFHTVVRGDTLSAIARRYGVTLSALRRANPAALGGLFPGNLIAVP